ncbi:T9SS type A sorting domain-containing protein [Flavitalea sp.]|nr:T9SS type A sorting domain-containing protein [Flavitalea sp.]
MKHYPDKTILKSIFIIICLFSRFIVNGQPCTPAGDQTTYGTGNVWIGYVYSGTNFNTYRGYVNEGNAGNYEFDQNFGGSSVSYVTNGCPITTNVFSVRYKLTKTFTNQNIDFTVSGDDGFRLSIDGGATWLINRWNDQGYTSVTTSAFMNGSYNMVLEYYENAGDNRVTFSAGTGCTGAGNPAVYGINNTWQAYIYQGTNFNSYKGSKTEGSVLDPNFDESFGGDNVAMNFLTCPINTEAFSARFRLTRNMPAGTYIFTIGGDDGYRFSLDGGATWVIDRWVDQSYNVTSYTTTLSGNRNMVIEYYENSGGNRISFTMSASLLPVKLTSFNASAISENRVQLNWTSNAEVNFNRYIIQRSYDGRSFTDIATRLAKTGNSFVNKYSQVDQPSKKGNIYYRLAMEDLDGSVTYSSIATVSINNIAANRIYPTVVNGKTIFLESTRSVEKANIDLYDMNGRKISSTNTKIVAGKQEINLAAGTSAKGSYLVRITDQQGPVLSQTIIIQ